MTQIKKDTIFLAAQFGDLTAVENFIQTGIDVNAKDPASDFSALHYAAGFGHEELIRPLVKFGADPKMTTNNGTTPILLATEKGHEPVIRTLVKLGADPKVQRKDGITPMYNAAAHGHEPVIRTLVELGADPKVAVNNGETPIHIAAHYGHEAVIRTLVELGVNPNVSMNDGTKPIHLAAKEGHEAAVRALIELNANPNGACTIGRTALYLAAKNNHLTIVKELIASGADLSIYFSVIQSPIAGSIDNPDIVLVLNEAMQNRVSLKILNRVDTFGHPDIRFTEDELIQLATFLANKPEPRVSVIHLGKTIITEAGLQALHHAIQNNQTIGAVIFPTKATVINIKDSTTLNRGALIRDIKNKSLDNTISLSRLCAQNFGIFATPLEDEVCVVKVEAGLTQ